MRYARTRSVLNTVIKSPAVMWMETPFCYRKIFSVGLIASASSGFREWSVIKLLISCKRKCLGHSVPSYVRLAVRVWVQCSIFGVCAAARLWDKLHLFKAKCYFWKYLSLSS